MTDDSMPRKIAELALLLGDHISDAIAIEPDDLDQLIAPLSERIAELDPALTLWSHKVRDATIDVVEDYLEERERKRLAIPVVQASRWVPVPKKSSQVAAYVWSRSLTMDDQEHRLRREGAVFIGCEPDEFTVTLTGDAHGTIFREADGRSSTLVVWEGPCIYTVKWHGLASSIELHHARQVIE